MLISFQTAKLAQSPFGYQTKTQNTNTNFANYAPEGITREASDAMKAQTMYSLSFGSSAANQCDMHLHFDKIRKRHNIDSQYRETIEEAYNVLNKKNVALIMHGVSFPSIPSEDTGFGTYNSGGAKQFMSYINGMFNAIQLGPNGQTQLGNPSPYMGTSFSQNMLFGNLKSLTGDEWYNLLSDKTFKAIVKNNPSKNTNHASYRYAMATYREAYNEVWENFKELDAPGLKKEFETFKKQNQYWLEPDSLYEVLSIEHGNDYWPMWDSELDRNLFDEYNNTQAAKKRKLQLAKQYKDEIETYKLIQFILAKQSEETKKYAAKEGIKMIGDRQVAFSHRDIWAHKSAFLKDWYMGCPPDYFTKDGQAWGFSVLDPEKMFNKNGTLGESGKVLYNMFFKMFKENPGGVRIDHIIGQIDPWWYREGHKPSEYGTGDAARAYSTPYHHELGKYSNIGNENITKQNGITPDQDDWVAYLTDEQIDAYGRIIRDVILKAAQDAGLPKESIIAEDLGSLTYPVREVMNRLQLPGMRVLQYTNPDDYGDKYRCKNIEANSWVTAGSHDNEPIWTFAQKLGEGGRERYSRALMDDLYRDFDNKGEIWDRLVHDDKFFAMSKLIEAFACGAENVQISFMDMFGLSETYNVPGTVGDENWSLELEADFKKQYTDAIASGRALNLPFILSCAIRARGRQFANQNKALLDKLDKLAFDM